ncbi:hypothetical protein V1477_006675 [Vespula maculifrons]|uniref:Transposase IS200-like domain-containing protein n=1 Tax=Vespula maculifrons TaxID=7453 RepID=A0ABD2CJH3_VESMC
MHNVSYHVSLRDHFHICIILRDLEKTLAFWRYFKNFHQTTRVFVLSRAILRDQIHDRSCLEISEADGVDGGVLRKQGLVRLQFSDRPVTPEAERHLEREF